MKFHLPKKLLVAVLAATMMEASYATLTPTESITSGTLVTDAEAPETPAVLTKDGDGVVTATGTVKKYASIYVRGGELKVGDGTTPTTLTVYPGSAGAGSLNIGGDDAVVTFNKATFVNKDEAFRIVGNADGSGTLNLTNGSEMTAGDCEVFSIGATHNGNDTGYKGTYHEAQNGSGVLFGRGDVNVSGGSTLLANHGSFFMGEGSLTVSGEQERASKVQMGYSGTNGGYFGTDFVMGWMENSTSEITVKSYASVDVYAYEDGVGGADGFVTSYYDNTVSNITVNGEEAVFSIKDDNTKRVSYSYFGVHSNNTETNLIIKNGGTVNVGSDKNYLGSDTKEENNKVNIEVSDSSSTLNFMGEFTVVRSGVTLTNYGTVNVSVAQNRTFYVYSGEIHNKKGATFTADAMQLWPDDAAKMDRPLLNNEGTLHVTGRMYTETADIINTGSIKTNVLVQDASALTMKGGNASIVIEDEYIVRNGASITLEANTSATPAITTNTLSIDTSANSVTLTYSDDFLSKVTDDGQFSIYFANVSSGITEQNIAGLHKVTLAASNLVWDTEALAWDYTNEKELYITGTLKKKDVVDFTDKDLVLDSPGALDTDKPVVTLGETTISTADGITANLSGAIQNGGNLTIEGTYSAEADTLETTDIDSTHLCVDNKEGNNGFLREGATGLVVVDNKDGGELTVGAGTTLTVDGTTYALSTSGNALQVDYSTYHINEDGHEASFSKIKSISESKGTQDVAVQMKGGVLFADTDVTKLEATGGTIAVLESNPSTPTNVGGDIAGDTEVVVTNRAKAVVSGKLSGDASVLVSDGAEVTISGTENTQTGAVVINNATLKVGDGATLGKSKVHLDNQGKLDLNNQAVSNYINVTGCTLCNASAYEGNVDVSGNLSLDGDANANMVTLVGSGNIRTLAGETLTVGTLAVAAGAAHPDQISAATTVRTDIVLNGGSVLTMNGTLTLEDGTTITLQGRGYHAGQEIVTAGAGSALDTKNFTVKYYGQVQYEATDTTITLLSVFDQRYADLFTVGNWGHATASRAFVNAVRGQRTNTGCIANGRGTAWAALLGGYHDIAGSDIDLKGAAMGVDVKLGEKSSVGVALGYVESDTKPTGWSTLDQTGTYIALYGEHGLKKLSSTSCLSLDWVVAYGQGESEIASTSWEQDSLQLNSRLSWNKKLSDRLCMSVFGGLEYYTNESDTVDGMKTGSIQNLRGELGVGASYVVWGVPGIETITDEKGAEIAATGTGCRRLVVHGELRYMNDMVRSNPVIRMDGMSGTGENPGRSGIGIEAGATYRFNDRWSASANYGFNALDDSREHRVNVGASYTF